MEVGLSLLPIDQKTIWQRKHADKHEKRQTTNLMDKKINLIWNRVLMQCRLLTLTLGTILFNFISQSCIYYLSCDLHFIMELDHPSWRISYCEIYHASQKSIRLQFISHISHLWSVIKHIYWYPFNLFIPVILFDKYDLIDKNVIKV